MVVRTPTRLQRSRGVSLATRLELLETRTLLSAITNYQVDDILGATSSAVDGNGDLWVGNQVGGLEKIHKNVDGTLTTTDIAAGDSPSSIAYDAANGHIFIANFGGALDELDLNGNLLNQYSTPNPDNAPDLITAAKDGSIWFSDEGDFAADANQTYTADIGRLDVTTGTFSIAQIPVTNTQPVSIKAAPDGSVWFGTSGIDNPITFGLSALGHGTVSSNGSINLTLYTIPHNFGELDDIAVAPDNSIWYGIGGDGNSGSHRPAITETIDHATLTGGSLSVTEYAMPETASESDISPSTLNFDSSGRLWFTDMDAIDYIDTATGDITRMNPLNDGAVRAGMSVSSTDVWTVSNGGNTNVSDISLASFAAPLASTSPDIVAGAGAFTGPVAAFVSSDTGNFSYTIDFGNGTTQTGTLPSNASGLYTIDGSTTYAAAGTYSTLVTITSDAGDTVAVNGQAVVTSGAANPLMSQGVNLQAQRGVALAPNVSGVTKVVVAQFSGPASNYSASIHWGDGTTSAGLIVALGSNQYYVELPSGSSKSYAAVGTYNVSVVIGDGTSSTTATSTATISEVPVTASQNLVLQPLLGGIVLTTVGTFTADTTSTASWFTATITWGDGTHSTGLVLRTGAGTYAIIGLHLYTKKGTYSVSAAITDSVDVEHATATATIKIK